MRRKVAAAQTSFYICGLSFSSSVSFMSIIFICPPASDDQDLFQDSGIVANYENDVECLSSRFPFISTILTSMPFFIFSASSFFAASSLVI